MTVSNRLPTDILFIHTGPPAEQEAAIRRAIAENTPDNVSRAVGAIDPSAVVLVVDDEVVYVVKDTLLEMRLNALDTPLGLPFDTVVGTQFCTQTQLRSNRILGGRPEFPPVVYSWANLFGGKSIALGPRYRQFIESDDFAKMVGRKLQNVNIRLRIDGQYEVSAGWGYRD